MSVILSRYMAQPIRLIELDGLVGISPVAVPYLLLIMNMPPWQIAFGLIVSGAVAGMIFGIFTYILIWITGP
jgi:hypothetical protein